MNMSEESAPVADTKGDRLVDLGNEYAFRRSVEKKKVCVIGAGPAGLGALRHLAETDFDVVCFEQGPSIGGTWLYTDAVGKDDLGVPVHSSLYKNLVSNLPKEVMFYPGFPYKGMDHSYVNSEEVLEYLTNYSKEFQLEKYIKFKHRVTRVKPLVNLYSVTAVDLTTKNEQHFIFDFVMVCSGPHITPVYPQIEIAKFSGTQLHSKEYKVPEPFTGKRVLVIGLGPSGLDITFHLKEVAQTVMLSRNIKPGKENLSHLKLPEEIILKPDVKSVEDKIVTFMDDSSETIDVIIHCTGYTYNFSFLDPDCGVTVDQYVFPLYKHLISIERPTMCIIGLPKLCSHLYMVDYQVRCFIKVIEGKVHLPSTKIMMDDYNNDIEVREKNGQKKKDFHKLGKQLTVKYFDDLSALGDLEPIPPIQISLFNEAFFRAITDFGNFRKDVYRIIDDENYEMVKPS